MKYEGRIYRPPSEGRSVLIQLTVGCSHNQCAFCAMYNDKKYRVRPLDEVFVDVDEAARVFYDARRVFICDGDALSTGFEPFSALCERIKSRFTHVERIAAYVNARDILRLSPEELCHLRHLGFSLGYLGLESGSAQVLEFIRKGATPSDMIEMAQKAREADIALSAIVLLGAGGCALSDDHIRGTIEVVNAMQPKYLSFLTAMIVPRTPLMVWAEEGTFAPLTDRAILREAKGMLEGLNLHDTLFRMNHVSNLVPLGGHLPQDKTTLLRQIDMLLPLAWERVACICTEEEGLML